MITGYTTDSQSENYPNRNQHFGEFVPFKLMHVIGANSLHKALQSLKNDKKRKISAHITAIPGLSLNPRVQNPLNNNLILWHDLVNNTITKHWRTNIPEETPEHFIETLKKIKSPL